MKKLKDKVLKEVKKILKEAKNEDGYLWLDSGQIGARLRRKNSALWREIQEVFPTITPAQYIGRILGREKDPSIEISKMSNAGIQALIYRDENHSSLDPNGRKIFRWRG